MTDDKDWTTITEQLEKASTSAGVHPTRDEMFSGGDVKIPYDNLQVSSSNTDTITIDGVMNASIDFEETTQKIQTPGTDWHDTDVLISNAGEEIQTDEITAAEFLDAQYTVQEQVYSEDLVVITSHEVLRSLRDKKQFHQSDTGGWKPNTCMVGGMPVKATDGLPSKTALVVDDGSVKATGAGLVVLKPEGVVLITGGWEE